VARQVVPDAGSATGKAPSPTVDSRVRRTGSDVVNADRRRVLILRSVGWRSSSARYVGAVLWMHLYVRTANLELSATAADKGAE